MHAWYILAVKYVVIVSHTFAVLKHKVLGVGFLSSLPGTPFPSLPHRLQYGIAKRQVQYSRAKRYNAIVANV